MSVRLYKYGNDIELRIQYPHQNTGIAQNNHTLTLYQITSSANGTGTETALGLTRGTNYFVSEISSTGIYRVHIDSGVFTNDPANNSLPLLFYGSITESSNGATVNIPQFEIVQLGQDDLNTEVLALKADLNAEVGTAFTGFNASVSNVATALKAIWDDTNDIENTIWNEVISSTAHAITNSAGARLYALSETWASGGANETLLSELHTRLGTTTNTTGTSTIFGLLNEILADTGTTLDNLIGSPANGNISADILDAKTSLTTDVASVQTDTTTLLTRLGTSAISTHASVAEDTKLIYDDQVALQADATTLLSRLGTSAISGNTTVAQDTLDIFDRIGVPAGGNHISDDIASARTSLTTDVASNKTDLTTLLSRLGSVTDSASLGQTMFGAIKYIAQQSQIIQGGTTAPARAEVQFPTHILAPQGVSAKYMKLAVYNRNNQNQLERPRALGDDGTQVNARFTFNSDAMDASQNGAQLTITIGGATETWTFYESGINGTTYTSGKAVGASAGYFVYSASAGKTAYQFMKEEGLSLLQRFSELPIVFEFEDANSSNLLLCPMDYSQAITLTFTAASPSGTAFISAVVNSTAVAGVGQLFLRVLVDGVVTTGRLFKDASGNTAADASTAANSSNDGNLGRSAPATSYSAMIGQEGVGQFFLYYKVSAGQTENVTFEVYGLDKNRVEDTLDSAVPTDSIESVIIASHHTTVQTQSLAGMGVAF